MNARSILFAFALATVACGHMPPEEARAALHDPNPTMRQHAADALRRDDMAPEDVQALMQAVQGEQDLHAKAAMMISLGASASPQAKPLIDDYVAKAGSFDEQKYAGRALKYWMINAGQLPKDYKFPTGWPYGTPGYPPIITK